MAKALFGYLGRMIRTYWRICAGFAGERGNSKPR